MSIIMKFLFKNIFEKKFRTFLILFSVTMATALFFSSNTISDALVKMVVNKVSQVSGGAEITISPGEKSSSKFLRMDSLQSIKPQTDFIVGIIQEMGVYKLSYKENINVSLMGMDYEDLNTLYKLNIKEESSLLPFEGNKVIISSYTAEKYNLKLGNFIDVEANEKSKKYKVSGISSLQGPFGVESQAICMIIPKKTASTILDSKDMVSTVYIKLKDSSKKDEYIEQLKKTYSRYNVSEPIPVDELKTMVDSMSTPFMLMTAIVTMVSVFIIYTSFKVIVAERLPIIGTMRSIGATKKITDLIMILESAIYGFVGGILGCFLGKGILAIMMKITTEGMSNGIPIDISTLQMLKAWSFAFVLCVVSSFLPIIKVSKIPIKNIVLNIMQSEKLRTAWKIPAASLMLAVALILPRVYYVNSSLMIVFHVVCILLIMFSAMLLAPFVTYFFVKVFERLYVFAFGNVGILAAKNLNGNKNLINNISLLALGISSLLFINTISGSVTREVLGIYVNSMKFDLTIYSKNMDRDFLQQLARADGIGDVYSELSTSSVEVTNSNKKIMQIVGIDKSEYFDYWNIELPKDVKSEMDTFENERNILLSETLKDRFEVKKGDLLPLKIDNTECEYRVVGFFDTLLNNGDYAMVPYRYLKLDTGISKYTVFYAKTNKDPQIVADALKKQFERESISVQTKKEQQKQNEDSNQQFFIILKGFSVMAAVIGIFGIFNNLMISFIERKRTFAIMRSVGLSKNQMIKMIIIESATCGIIGGVLGLLSCIAILSNAPSLMRAMIGVGFPMYYSKSELITAFVCGIVIMIVATLVPAIKTSKSSIIQSIKFE